MYDGDDNLLYENRVSYFFDLCKKMARSVLICIRKVYAFCHC
jgi:hypothetical protein